LDGRGAVVLLTGTAVAGVPACYRWGDVQMAALSTALSVTFVSRTVGSAALWPTPVSV
jgi:hypothetical protein